MKRIAQFLLGMTLLGGSGAYASGAGSDLRVHMMSCMLMDQIGVAPGARYLAVRLGGIPAEQRELAAQKGMFIFGTLARAQQEVAQTLMDHPGRVAQLSFETVGSEHRPVLGLVEEKMKASTSDRLDDYLRCVHDSIDDAVMQTIARCLAEDPNRTVTVIFDPMKQDGVSSVKARVGYHRGPLTQN